MAPQREEQQSKGCGNALRQTTYEYTPLLAGLLISSCLAAARAAGAH